MTKYGLQIKTATNKEEVIALLQQHFLEVNDLGDSIEVKVKGGWRDEEDNSHNVFMNGLINSAVISKWEKSLPVWEKDDPKNTEVTAPLEYSQEGSQTHVLAGCVWGGPYEGEIQSHPDHPGRGYILAETGFGWMKIWFYLKDIKPHQEHYFNNALNLIVPKDQ